jgi:diguanylate cyclase (GGDEF)-like protein/putative nucleotidyltransferase with HDIG domain
MGRPDLRFAARLYIGSLLAAVAVLVGLLAPRPMLWRGGYWIAALAAVSLYLAYRAYTLFVARLEHQQRYVQEMADLHLATIEALALAIDAKDQVGQRHVRRMQVYAEGIARALGMAENDIQGVKTASLLHDIGKLAVPEHILSKPGPLTQEEFQKIRIHPQVGAEIIGSVPFPYPVAPLILSHHERWDGNGYPYGLAGDAIPPGARILAVVDYFDALITDRPFQRPVAAAAALDLLKLERGKALDADIVDTFLRVYPALAAKAEAGEDRPIRARSIDAPQSATTPAYATGAPAAHPNVFHDIALAHREIHSLYEIAQAMGSSLGVADTMALISSKLSNLVPFSCCALFLLVDDAGTMRCQYASGVDADLLQQLTVRDGQGLTGWVARNKRPLINARPAADLEASGEGGKQTVLESTLMCPLVFNDRFIGTLAVYHTEPSIYTDDHRRLLDRISEQAAAVIHHSLVFEQTQDDSLRDPLTGLPNTRYMFLHLTRELARAERLHSEVSIIVMDLDDFKDINDTHGHHVGDRALRDVAIALQSAIRPYDICVRYAGDEFVVVLSACGAEEAERKRLDLQKAIDEVRFEVRPGRTLPLAISAGAAVFPHDGQAYEAVLAAADGRMYQDKTRRKRQGAPLVSPPPPDPAEVSDTDVKRAALGLL